MFKSYYCVNVHHDVVDPVGVLQRRGAEQLHRRGRRRGGGGGGGGP